MRAALFPEKGEVIFTEIGTPKAGAGEALIEVKYAGICGSDVNVWKGLHPTATYPRVPGHEFVGILREISGEAKEELSPGDVVVVQPYDSCGICGPCTSGQSNVCRNLSILGIHQDGGFAEYAVVPADKVYKLPADVDLKVAALTEPLAVAVHDVRKSGLQVGQTVLIIGGGPIGMLQALVSREAGASRVFISEINENRIRFIQSLGFETVNPAKEDIEEVTAKVTDGKGFDVVFEVSGSRAGISTMTKVVKIGGTVMVIGMSPESYPVDTGAMFAKELKLQGVRLHSQDAFEGAVKLVASGKLNDVLCKLIDKVFPLSEIAQAMDYQISDKEHFKVVIDISK